MFSLKWIKFKGLFPPHQGEGYDCMDAGGRATHGAVAEGGVIYNDPLPLAPSLREGE